MIELCPVGALTSTQYRFEARPWEIQNVPTVCGLCPVGCNVSATVREGKVKRILSRNHPEVDGGWLCDKGRFSFPHLCAADRITDPLLRGARASSRRRGTRRSTPPSRCSVDARAQIVTALSGSETLEQAYALARLLRGGLGAHSAVLPESTSSALDAFRLPLSAIAEAEIVVIVGDDAVADRAPGRRPLARQARRNGAEVVTIGPTGSIQAAARERARRRSARSRSRATSSVSGCAPPSARSSSGPAPGGGGGARLAEAAHALGFEGKPGSGAFHLPATPNGRGVAEAWAARRTRTRRTPSRSRS